MRFLAATLLALVAASVALAAPARPLLLSSLSGPECTRAAPLHGGGAYGNLSFFYNLSRPATVTLSLERRDGSRARRSCPVRRGHTLGTYSPVLIVTRPGDAGANQIIVGRAASVPAGGRRRISIAARTLRPGTYVLFLSAAGAGAARSNTLTMKFWILAPA